MSTRLAISVVLFHIAVFSGNALADLLVEDTMTTNTSCSGVCGAGRTIHGGVFSASGWTTNTTPANQSKLIYDLGETIDCGSATFTVSNFHSYTQFVGTTSHEHGQFAEFFGLFNGAHGNQRTAIDNNESIILLRYAPCTIWNGNTFEDCHPPPHTTRDQVWWALGLCPGSTPWIDQPLSQPVTGGDFTFRIDWDPDKTMVYVNQTLLGTADPPFFADTCVPTAATGYRYLYIGHTRGLMTGSIIGPTYSNLTVTSCQDTCVNHCSNSQQDCGEQGVDCGGACTPCNTAPLTGKIQVFATDGTRLDGGGPAAYAGDMVILRAEVDDAETADPDVRNARFFLRTQGSATWNVLDAVPAVYDSSVPVVNWMYTWTIPTDADIGFYDIRFDYEDADGLVASQTQTDEFSVALPLLPDAGPDPVESGPGDSNGVPYDASASVDSTSVDSTPADSTPADRMSTESTSADHTADSAAPNSSSRSVAGCSCRSGTAPSHGSWILLGLLGIFLAGRRHP